MTGPCSDERHQLSCRSRVLRGKRLVQVRRNIKIVAGAAVVGLVAAGGAFAFWSASGSGSGTAAAAADSTPISVSGTAVTGLVPGGPAKVISGTFTNTNPAPVAIPGVVVSISSVSGTCAASNFEIVGAAAAATVPVGTSGTWTGPTIKLKDTGVF